MGFRHGRDYKLTLKWIKDKGKRESKQKKNKEKWPIGGAKKMKTIVILLICCTIAGFGFDAGAKDGVTTSATQEVICGPQGALLGSGNFNVSQVNPDRFGVDLMVPTGQHRQILFSQDSVPGKTEIVVIQNGTETRCRKPWAVFLPLVSTK